MGSHYLAMSEEEQAFCVGDGTDMFMAGFSSSLAYQEPCVTLLWQRIVLNTRGKFITACLVVAVFGVVLEGLIFVRRKVNNKAGKVSLFMLNIIGAYFAMLVAMTYCVELFLCIILGQAAGHAIFNTGGDKGINDDTEKEDAECPGTGAGCHSNTEYQERVSTEGL